jgi:cell division protein FtsI/penicillin-binding protein 2
VQRELSPGSVLKPFTVVAALEAGISRDHAFGDGDMASILERSSNAGALQIAALAGKPSIDAVFGRVGMPVPAGVSLERLALGDGVRVTPLQLETAWSHLSGHRAISPEIAAQTREMLVRAVVGEQATGKQAAVPGVAVAGKTGTAPLADGGHLASFVGLVPADDPELVILVCVARPQGEAVWGGVVAAPAFRSIVEGLSNPTNGYR